MRSKKILGLLCATLIVANLFGCGKKKEQSSTTESFYSGTDTTVSFIYIDEETDALLTKIDAETNKNAKEIKSSKDPAKEISKIIEEIVKASGKNASIDAVGYDSDAGYAYYTINDVFAGTSIS